MDIKENKGDTESKPNSGVRDPKDKQGQLEQHPRKGRNRPASTQDEVQDPTEIKTSQERVRIQQGHKNHRSNTN